MFIHHVTNGKVSKTKVFRNSTLYVPLEKSSHYLLDFKRCKEYMGLQ